MKDEIYTIHSNPGGIIDCSLIVAFQCDGETASMQFPQITQETDNIGPSVYACLNDSELTIRLTGVEDVDISYSWNEKERKWIKRQT